MLSADLSNPLVLDACRQSSSINDCRVCGSATLDDVLDLGVSPLANRLLKQTDISSPEPTFPLRTVFCRECGLLQITETVNPEVLFGHYLYFSSFSDTLLLHAREIAESILEQKPLDSSSLVVEAASNDGYLLRNFKERGIPVLGVEPATNVAQTARDNDLETANDFFGLDFAERMREDGQRADVFIANNVLAHVDDLNGFVKGIHAVLADDGLVSIEVPYVRDLIEGNEFDTIYHEHLSYFSASTLERLFANHDLEIFEIQRVPIHGGSLRIWAGKSGSVWPRDSVREILADEARLGITCLDFYSCFAQRVESLKADLTELLSELCEQGKRIVAYGASAKGTTLLNYFGIGSDKIEYVVDRSTVKQGHYTPGTRLPIYAPEKLVEDVPDYVLLLTWNFANEILEQQTEYRQRGGKFIVPIPQLAIV